MSEWQPIETAPKDGRQIKVLGGWFDTDSQDYGMKNVEEDGYIVYTSNTGNFYLDEESLDQIRKPDGWRENE